MLGGNAEECGSWERELTPEERAKENGGEPVNFIPMGDATDRGTHLWAPSFGLTKRELFAAMAMQGFCARGPVSHIDLTARTAVDVADALLAELAKPQEPTP